MSIEKAMASVTSSRRIIRLKASRPLAPAHEVHTVKGLSRRAIHFEASLTSPIIPRAYAPRKSGISGIDFHFVSHNNSRTQIYACHVSYKYRTYYDHAFRLSYNYSGPDHPVSALAQS